MILGRSALLWGALLQGALNLVMAGIVVATGQPLGPDVVALFAAGNAFGLAIIGIIANERDPATVPTFALTTTPTSPSTSSSGPASAIATGSSSSSGTDPVDLAGAVAAGTDPAAGAPTDASGSGPSS